MKPVKSVRSGGRKFTSYIRPMLATLTERAAFDSPDWVFEIKWDGYRAIGETSRKGNRLYSRNGLSFESLYPEVFKALSSIKKELVLDGEIVVFDKNNRPDFQLLQNYRGSGRICYYVFDCLAVSGKDITSKTLLERKQILRSSLPENEVIRYCDHIEGLGTELFDRIQEQRLEGMIAKRIDSKYESGKRTPNWLKIKNVKSEEAVIAGFTPPKGSRTGFGSLLLGQFERNKLRYVGNVGTGFTDAVLRQLALRLTSLKVSVSPFSPAPKVPRSTTWVTPSLVCNVKYTEKTKDGILRHPVFQGLRIDKSAKEVHPEKNNV